MEQSVYVLDANVFIEAARRYYAFDLAPKFWESLLHHASNGLIESIDRVKKEELDKGNDELKDWANSQFNHAFRSTDEDDITESYGKVMAWVQGQSQYTDAAKSEFANEPDGWWLTLWPKGVLSSRMKFWLQMRKTESKSQMSVSHSMYAMLTRSQCCVS